MVRLLPPRPSLEHLKHQAKDLLDAYRQGEPEAQARFWRLFPPPDPEALPPPMRLTQAQLAEEALTRDVAPLLLRVAREDLNSKVQGEALWGLCGQAPDDALIAPLSAILREASHPRVRGLAHAALKRHSPAYRQEAYRRAREEGMARQASLVRNA